MKGSKWVGGLGGTCGREALEGAPSTAGLRTAGSGHVRPLPARAHVVSLFSAGTSADGNGPVIDAPLIDSVVSAVKPLLATAFRSPVSGVFVMLMVVRLLGSAGSEPFKPQLLMERLVSAGNALAGGSAPYK